MRKKGIEKACSSQHQPKKEALESREIQCSGAPYYPRLCQKLSRNCKSSLESVSHKYRIHRSCVCSSTFNPGVNITIFLQVIQFELRPLLSGLY